MKGIFLCAYKQRHFNYDIDYNDIVAVDGINILGSCEDVDLSNYDYLLATPPCTYYSRANWRRDISKAAQDTKHLLPSILLKFARSGKPFLIENVRNPRLFEEQGIYKICEDYGVLDYVIGRHTYFTNIFINLSCDQRLDFKKGGYVRKYDDEVSYYPKGTCAGGKNVLQVFDIWLSSVVK